MAGYFMFQYFNKIFAILFFAWIEHYRKDHEVPNNSVDSIKNLVTSLCTSKCRLLSILDISYESENDFFKNSDMCNMNISKLKRNKKKSQKNILKNIDNYFEKKLFKKISEIHNYMDETDIHVKKSITGVFKNVFIILALPTIVYLSGAYILIKGYEWNVYLINFYILFSVLSIFMLLYIFIKILKRRILRAGKLKPRLYPLLLKLTKTNLIKMYIYLK
ncbi:variable surface protein [Plasmodium gonderi]|uniref:Variable surface protein n=1 Tax=Plasmodium gonderi TaxID=77519 RepID=A0A1Y1JS53_PLAGO|nr:variable surface protein [Plasmodium gonderi]GAW84278.1 variable surface protein [Plasmodium gonderi]